MPTLVTMAAAPSATRRVVITGIGVVSPIGIGSKSFWDALCAGTVGVSRITAFDAGGFASQIAGQVPPFKVGQFIPKDYRKRINVMARDIELAVVAADDAFKDAGLRSKAYTDKPEFDGTRFGCNIGAGLISVDLNELASAMATSADGDKLDLAKWGSAGMQQLTPLWLLKYLPNMLACHVTIIHGAQRAQQHDHLRRRQQPPRHRRGVPHHPARRRRPGHLRRSRNEGPTDGPHAPVPAESR